MVSPELNPTRGACEAEAIEAKKLTEVLRQIDINLHRIFVEQSTLLKITDSRSGEPRLRVFLPDSFDRQAGFEQDMFAGIACTHEANGDKVYLAEQYYPNSPRFGASVRIYKYTESTRRLMLGNIDPHAQVNSLEELQPANTEQARRLLFLTDELSQTSAIYAYEQASMLMAVQPYEFKLSQLQ